MRLDDLIWLVLAGGVVGMVFWIVAWIASGAP